MGDDIADALAIDKSTTDGLPEGKVPLFYIDDMTLASQNGNQERVPLYFRRKEVLQEWKRLHPSQKVPEVKVTELFSVVAEMVRPGVSDDELERLYFIAPLESDKRA